MLATCLLLAFPPGSQLSQLDLPLKSVREVTVREASPRGFVSDDGTTLFVVSGSSFIARYELPSGKSIDPPRNALHAWSAKANPKKLYVFTDSQFKYTPLGTIPATKTLYDANEFMPIGSLNRLSLLTLFSASAASRKKVGVVAFERAPRAWGIAQIFIDKRGLSPNIDHALPAKVGERYIVLDSQIGESSTKLLLARVPLNGGSGRLDWWIMSGTALRTISTGKLTKGERWLQGRLEPSTLANRPIANSWLDVLPYDGNGSLLYVGKIYDLRTGKQRTIVAPDPFAAGYSFFRGRLYCNARSGAYSKLYREDKPGKWTYLGPYNIVGSSSSRKYLVLDRFDVKAPNNSLWVVEP